MVSCYRCNAALPRGVPITRLRVEVGESNRVSAGRRYWSTSRRATYAEKPFCEACIAARQRDQDDAEAARRAKSRKTFMVLMALVGFFFVLGAIGSKLPPAPQDLKPARVVVQQPQAAPPDMAFAAGKRSRKRNKPIVRKVGADATASQPSPNEPYELLK